MNSSFRRFGASQGRVVHPYNGELQCFPKDLWETEFHLAAALGMGHIELLAERQFNSNNPLWSVAGIQSLQKAAKASGLRFYSGCNDFVIDHPLLSNSEGLEQAIALLKPFHALGCSVYVLPLFEKSEITAENFEKFVPALKAVAKAAGELNIQLSLETLLPAHALISLCSKIGASNLGICYDTGNRAAMGAPLGDEIRLLDALVNHVHLKDKNKDGANVLVGTGAANFYEVFQELNRIRYEGAFTFETNRGQNPFNTMRHNLHFMEFMMKEAVTT